MENAPQTTSAVGAYHLQRLGPRIAHMDGDGQSVVQRKVDLSAESFGLLRLRRAAPVEIEADFADGAPAGDALGRRGQITFDERQLLAPTGIFIDGGRMQPHHRNAAVGMLSAEVE